MTQPTTTQRPESSVARRTVAIVPAAAVLLAVLALHLTASSACSPRAGPPDRWPQRTALGSARGPARALEPDVRAAARAS